MRLRLPLFPTLLGAILLAAFPFRNSQAAGGSQALPASVDNLAPDDVTKAIGAMKESFVRPEALSDSELARATLQGLLDRLEPEVSLVTGTANTGQASPFYGETPDARTGYLRPGALTAENIAKAREVLKDWSAKGIGAVVLDLRGTPPSNDFDAAADLARLFSAKGTEMFSLYAGKAAQPVVTGTAAVTGTGDARTFSAEADPVFKGILVVLVDEESAEAPEAVAAALRTSAKALVVGDKTAGRAFEYRDVPLQGAVLRVAVARVILSDGTEPGSMGLKPDIDVALGAPSREEVMQSITDKGVASVTAEHDRPHLNEAALVAGNNPEVDELEAEAGGKKTEEGIVDRQLQRALDLVTSISIYEAKGEPSPGTGE